MMEAAHALCQVSEGMLLTMSCAYLPDVEILGGKITHAVSRQVIFIERDADNTPGRTSWLAKPAAASVQKRYGCALACTRSFLDAKDATFRAFCDRATRFIDFAIPHRSYSSIPTTLSKAAVSGQVERTPLARYSSVSRPS